MTHLGCSAGALRALLRPFHRDQSGTSLTEFVIALPVWILVFMGLLSVSKLGINTTANHMETQAKIWDTVIHAGKNPLHRTSVGGGGAAVAHSALLAVDPGNPHPIATGYNGTVVMGGLAAAGSWGESYGRTEPLSLVPGTDMPTIHATPDDALVVESTYAQKIVNDGVAGADWSTSGTGITAVIGAMGNIMGGTGAIAALGAGNRYGEVYAESTSEPITVWIGQPVVAHSHANILVGPAPLTGLAAKFAPFGFARIAAQSDKNYSVMMNYGKSEWTSGAAP